MKQKNWLSFCLTCALSVYSSGLTGLAIAKAHANNASINSIHDQMINVATLTNSLDEIALILKDNKEISGLVPNVTVGIESLSTYSKVNKELESLLNTLRADTFKGAPSLFSYRGRILSAFKKMQTCVKDFVASLKAIGELDAYLSLAKVYKKHKGNKNMHYCNMHYCFVNYEVGNEPQLKTAYLWDPLLNAEIATTRSDESALKALKIAIMMAQTCGIAPAESMTLVPAPINAYFKMVDSESKALGVVLPKA